MHRVSTLRPTRRLVLATLTSALISLPSLTAAQDSSPAASPPASPVASPVAANRTLLPSTGPDGLSVVTDSWDTLDSVSQELAKVTTREEIAASGYIGGATRTWSTDNPAAIPSGKPIYLEISIHAFEDADGAATGLPFIVDAFTLRGLQPLDVGKTYGDQSHFFTVTDPTRNVTIAQALIQKGARIYQVQVRTIDGDPLPDLLTWLDTLGLAPAA